MLTSEPSSQPWLTIALPVYNVAAYLPACLESIFEQIDGGVEVLAVEDCSTDNSLEILCALQSRWPSLRVLQHERNEGLSGARNTGLNVAQGQYIWLMDSDDLMVPGAIAQLRQTIERWRPDLVMCDFSVLRERMKFKHRLRGELHRSTFSGPGYTLIEDAMQVIAGAMRAGQLHTWSKIVRSSLWGDDLRFPPGRAFEDLFTTPKLLSRAHRAVYVPEPWVAYRQRDGSILKTLSLSKIEDQCEPLIEWVCPHPERTDAWARRARFEADAQAARVLTGACKQLWLLADSADARGLMASRFDHWGQNLHSGSLLSLFVGLLIRGRIPRLLRLMYWWLLTAHSSHQR